MGQEERGEIIAGLDIGTTKICAVVAEVIDNRVDVVGVGIHPSIGLRRGVVVNIESTVESIKRAVDDAEKMAGCQISSVYAGIAGSHIKGFNSRGLVPIRQGEVTQEDIDRVVDAASAVHIPTDQEVLHILPQEFMVDDQDGIQYPLGMTGVRLEADVHIVTGQVAAVQNIVKCCNRAGLEVCDVVLEPLASAEAVLTREEMELGIGLLDIGGGTSDLAIFTDGTIKHSFVLGLGGHNLTNDLSIGLRTPLKEAGILKEKYGSALASLIDKDQVIEVPSVGGRDSRRISRRVMGEILEPRVEEMLSLIKDQLKDSSYHDKINAGLVMTGGTSLLANMVDLAEQIFDLPVRIGYPKKVGGMADMVSTPQYATSLGLIFFAMKNESSQRFKNNEDGVFGRLAGRMRDWFRGAF
ncbi:MAG: cell division protein FtsA [Proteobacteria bacterium]|nr:cell division protein FtsA [Pseudomonadota bacterium]MBU1738969.1 cell division protein FtsA [Pseudomonadota bacterium]